MMEMMEEELEVGTMEGLELFFMTDNYVAEAVYYQGNPATRRFIS